MGILNKIFGDDAKKHIKALQPIVDKINGFEDGIKALSDQQLKDKTAEFRARLKDGETLDDILPEAFAVVREAARRTLDQRHYDVQLMGGIILHQGKIAEMRTGEGKTLVATLPVYLNALSEKGVHVVTVNDYLSGRDAAWMGQIYNFLGMSIGVINSDNTSFLYDPTLINTDEGKELDEERDTEGSFKIVHEFLRPCIRKEAYAADITYGTNNEFGFDYLRDNIAYNKEDLVQRPHSYAVVDEIDSILIDEARTPLIISSISGDGDKLYHDFTRIVSGMKREVDYTVDEKFKQIQLTDQGIEKAERALGVENIYTDKGIKYVHHLETAVRAKALFERDKDYVVRDGEVVIVDEFTGRMQPGRRWSEGLHQAVEAKEGVEVQKESRTAASITFQNYFRMYEKLSGMTGTGLTSQEEFYKVYGLDVVPVPTNADIQRIDYNDFIFQTEQGKFKALARKVKEINETGQPVLIGTVSIEKNELLSAYLKKEGVQHKMLNAKQHESEGEIIAQGGKKGSVVVATNMAGRGVDIKLGGATANEDEHEEIKAIGGLFVIGTERHEARRIDNQLRGRSGRQGDPGGTQFFVSLEDSLMRVFASDAIKNMMGRFGIPEDEPIENKMITRALENAQEKIEGFNFDARKQVLSYDDVMNTQRHSVYEKRHKLLLGDMDYVKEFYAEISKDDTEFAKVIEERKKAFGEEVFWETARKLALQVQDMLWMQHLEQMDYMRSSVNLRAYGQRDPLVEYKKEGLRLFRDLGESINAEIAHLLPNIGAGAFAREEQKLQEMRSDIAVPQTSAAQANVENEVKEVSKPIINDSKVGRNDPCPCGSGKKYKKCHGK
ncbi:preprotein translocase subunit SecA [Patescibacteria group bacterium]